MTMSFIRSRKAILIAVSAAVLAAGATASSEAGAKPFPIFPKPFPVFPVPFPKPLPKPIGPMPGPHFGYGGAALAGGLALGALAGAAIAEENDCPVVRRIVVDDDGNEYIRRVRVCD